MNIVIYARYSSHSQTEQSIEGQLQTCYEYAKNNRHTVVGEYIDRAQSGTTDSRVEFQRMIADSDKHTFEGVLVYQLDRFARNRYDSAINKAKLKKNGVRVLSARENISDDASGILVEGVLESMAEYYSAELSQKIRRGMNINAEKCLSNGSNPGLGYLVDEERHFHIDPETAPLVREIFERYASGETVADITKDLIARQIKTSIGKDFNKNSLHRLLRNRRYIGFYIYKDSEVQGGMPRIIEDELFQRVQHILDRNKLAPARSRKLEYLLTTKLFCGYCRELMTGYGGTGKAGKSYYYYACNNYKRHKCKKKVVSKQAIEDRVVLECRKLLTDSNIEKIAQSVAAACDADFDSSAVKRLKAALQEADTAIENLWKALESGQSVEMITGRIEKRQREKEELQAQIAIEMNRQFVFTAPQISAFLHSLKKGNVNDEHNRKGIINIFLRAFYLWDDKFTLILNGGDRPIEIDGTLLDEIEADNAAFACSSLVASAPPNPEALSNQCFGIFLLFTTVYWLSARIAKHCTHVLKTSTISRIAHNSSFSNCPFGNISPFFCAFSCKIQPHMIPCTCLCGVQERRCCRLNMGDFELFCERNQNGMYNVAVKVLRDSQQAEDATQEAFVRIFRIARTLVFEDMTAEKVYALRATKNVAIEILRKQKPTLDIEEAKSLLMTHEDALYRAVAAKETVQEISSILGERANTIFCYRSFGLSDTEIAATLGISMENVRSIAYRARLRLSEAQRKEEGRLDG